MSSENIIEILGGRKVKGGSVPIAGSSNQVTKCIIAALLTEDSVLIKGAPRVSERRVVQELFESLGGSIEHLDEETIRLTGKTVDKWDVSEEMCKKGRICVLTAAPLLHRFRKVSFYAPGGDKIGKRPLDFHVKGLQEMGAEVAYENGRYHLSVGERGLHGAHIVLPFPSVMATENLLMAASLAEGRTIIENAAIEPEIWELVKMLQKMGADIMVDANRSYVIQGVKKLKGCELRCMIDRNEAVSLACAALATGGDVHLQNVPHEPVYSFLNFIQRMGAEFTVNSKGIHVAAPRKLRATHIEIVVHPGFMTDWQQPYVALATQAEGVTVLHETVFEDRLGYTDKLVKMGANITLFSKCLGEAPCRFRNRNFVHSAIVQGPTPLMGQDFELPADIRAGMCLVIAGMVATGTTRLANIHELQRKYDDLVPKLQAMGADVKLTTRTN